MEELLDIYTRDGEYLGYKEKSICHSSNSPFYHKPAWIWIINNNNEILIQRRALSKKLNPNKWDMSCAGHVMHGETSIEGAIREIYEELGLRIKEEELKYIGEYIYDLTNEIAQIYVLKKDININDCKLREKEVSEIKWFNFDEFKTLFYSKDFVEFNDEYREYALRLLKNSLS